MRAFLGDAEPVVFLSTLHIVYFKFFLFVASSATLTKSRSSSDGGKPITTGFSLSDANAVVM